MPAASVVEGLAAELAEALAEEHPHLAQGLPAASIVEGMPAASVVEGLAVESVVGCVYFLRGRKYGLGSASQPTAYFT